MRFGQLGETDYNRLHRTCIRLELENMQGSPGEIGFRLGKLLFDSEKMQNILQPRAATCKTV